ncbi:MAG TPA: hypothetical protein DDY13_17370 [Cytophagales bacterium]|jgi:penicillin-binding protein 1A|nr:hypothetical protein [Cytophagales bacterium]
MLLKSLGVILIAFVLFMSSAVIYVLLEIPAPLPTKEQLSQVKNPEASILLDRKGKEIDRYYVFDRIIVPFEEISPHVIETLVATEDARFYEHEGIDYLSYPRVIFKTVLLGDRTGGGGSTITQQLAKNLFPRQDFGSFNILINKLRELIIASRIEAVYEKEEILALYLNTVPFGEGAFGIESAAKRYFDVSAPDLNLPQSALLTGLLKANSYYNPYRHFDRAIQRKNTVISLWHDHQRSNIDLDSLKQIPIKLAVEGKSEKKAIAAYFKAYVEKQLKDILQEIGKDNELAPSLYTDGLKIHTTLDYELQSMAEWALNLKMAALQKSFYAHWSDSKPWDRQPDILSRAVRSSQAYQNWARMGLTKGQISDSLALKRSMHIWSDGAWQQKNWSTLDSVKHYLMQMQAGLIAISPKDGHILAWVGGVDQTAFPYDHVYQAHRQIGSTFKPIVYATALEKGISPCDYVKAEQKAFKEGDQEWQPRNADENYEGKYSMTGALMESVNTVAVKTLEAAGIDETVRNANKMGIESDIPKVPSIALGAPSFSLFEMTAAYGTFANEGNFVKPLAVLKVEDRDGHVLWQAGPPEPRKVFTKKTAMLINNMLQKVVDEGTARSLRTTYGLGNNLAGKTGTTQNNADGWFIGYSPSLVVGAWAGCDDPAIHFRSTTLGQGAATALPIFAEFYRQMNKSKSFQNLVNSRFAPLPDNYRQILDCDPFKEEKSFFEWLFGKKKDKDEKAAMEPEKKKTKWWKRIFGKKEKQK